MQKKCFILFFFFCIVLSFSSIAQPFVVYDTIPIRHRTSKLRLYKKAEKWFKTEKGMKLLGKNWKERKLKGKGYFPYANYVQIPDIYLSSHAAEKTKGSIIFNVDVSIEDSIIVVKFWNFLHEARFTEYGTSSFGRLMDYEKVPSGKCMEVEEWCNAVWADMKEWSVYETKTRAKRMIPSTLIRKRTFKVVEEKELVPPKTRPEDDPEEFLNLDNYLLKDTEGKYADYDKWPEDIEAERAAAAAAAAAAAEKERKKEKPKDEYEDEEGYEDEDSGSEEIVAPTVPSVEEPSPKAEDDEKIDDYDDEDDEEVSVKPSKKEKSKKQPQAKAPKEKKPKKSKDDYDDDYDDYDDE
ncbi:MAG: hypothetical protein IKP99_06010 [Bacteroidales bacterium]|nr:hypothetical protein [Bacteroidales bacterium]